MKGTTTAVRAVRVEALAAFPRADNPQVVVVIGGQLFVLIIILPARL
jgi:hypothetical protein